jgi:hypothetical protein
MDDWDADEPRFAHSRGAQPDARPDETQYFWPAWLWPLLAWPPLAAWHARFVRDLPVMDPEALARAHLSPAAPEALAWIATALVLVAALVEAGFYGMLWAARGRRLPILAAAVAVVQAGALELAALDLIDAAGPAPAAWVSWLTGARVLVPHGAVAGAAGTAFGSIGIFTLARCAIFAGLQSGLVRCRWREAFALTCGTWMVSHVALWWLLELFLGRSMFTDLISR